MAVQAVAADAAAAEGAAAEVDTKPGRRKLPGKKLVLYVGAPLLALLLVGAGLYFTGLLGGADEATDEAAETEVAPSFFFDLPEMLVNLNSSGKKSSFLKITVSLELVDEDAVPLVESVMPRLIDNFQVYLHELRPEDLRGSAGLHRLREELLLRAAEAVKPAEVKDILFKEMLVQ